MYLSRAPFETMENILNFINPYFFINVQNKELETRLLTIMFP